MTSKRAGPPCKHMKGLLNEAADGTAAGLRLRFTKSHVAHCPRCERYLETLKLIVERLHDEQIELPDDVARRLNGLLAEAGREAPG